MTEYLPLKLIFIADSRNKRIRKITNYKVVYKFTGDGNWSNPLNWSNGVIPPSTLPQGSLIIVEPAANGECVIDSLQTVSKGALMIMDSGKKSG
jgi:hypothetical protein